MDIFDLSEDKAPPPFRSRPAENLFFIELFNCWASTALEFGAYS